MLADKFRLVELGLEGFGCSQILVLRALEELGKENPELVRAASGLHGGLGFSGKVCGALTGGCCVLAMHGGRGTAAEESDPDLHLVIQDLVDWFETDVAPRYGGIDCDDILAGDPRNRQIRCPEIIADVAAKLDELLARREANGRS